MRANFAKPGIPHAQRGKFVPQSRVHIKPPVRLVSRKLSDIKLADLVATALDIRPHKCPYIAHLAAVSARHFVHGFRADTLHNAGPTGMRRRRNPAPFVDQQNGRAVRDQNAKRRAAQI